LHHDIIVYKLLLPTTLPTGNGAFIVSGNRPPTYASDRRPPSVIRVHVDRHSSSTGPELVFGCYNIRSVTNKVDDLLEVRRDLSIDVLFLVETWHDTYSVAFRRLMLTASRWSTGLDRVAASTVW